MIFLKKIYLFIIGKFNGNALIYLFASLIGAFLSFITLRYFTKYLDASDYGIFGYVTALNTFLIPIFTLNLNSYYIKEYYAKKELQNRKALLGTLCIFLMVWSVVLISILSLVGGLIFKLSNFSFNFYPYMFYTLLSNIFLAPITFLLLQYRLLSKPWPYFFISMLQSILLLGIGLFFVSFYPWGVYGRILGTLIGTIILGILTSYLLIPHLRLSFSYKKLREGLKFCLPLIPYTLIILSYDTIDRYFLERYSSNLDLVGIYNVGFQYAAILSMFFLAFYKAYEPEIFRKVANHQESEISKIFIQLNWVTLGLSFVLIASSFLMLNFLTNGKFTSAAIPACYLILAFYFKGSYLMINTVLTASSRNKHILIVSILGFILLIAGSLLIIPHNNLYGTLWMKISLYFFSFIGSFFMLKKTGNYRLFLTHSIVGFLFLLLMIFLFKI